MSFDWRLDPNESLADYELEIVSQGEGDSTSATNVYRPHKVVLATASKYFLRTLTTRNGVDYVEGNEKKSRIELDPATAALVPHLLDYMYLLFSAGEIQEFLYPRRPNSMLPCTGSPTISKFLCF